MSHDHPSQTHPHLTPLSGQSMLPSPLPFAALKQWENPTPLIQSQGPKHSHVRLWLNAEKLYTIGIVA